MMCLSDPKPSFADCSDSPSPIPDYAPPTQNSLLPSRRLHDRDSSAQASIPFDPRNLFECLLLCQSFAMGFERGSARFVANLERE